MAESSDTLPSPTGPTYPDLPPLVDERVYQTVRAVVERLEARALPHEASLLRVMRRACELYEQTRPPYARALVIKDCTCGECGECRIRAELQATRAELDRHIANLTREWASHMITRQELHASRAAHELCIKERDFLERARVASNVAIETLLVQQGAGSSEFARSQPSDACEIVNLRARLEEAAKEAEAWRNAWGVLGPQTPEEVKTFDQVAYKVERDMAEYANKRRTQADLQNIKLGRRLHVKRAEARHWMREAGVFTQLAQNLWRIVRKNEHEIVQLTVDKKDLGIDVHALRMERDNAEAEAEALKFRVEDWHTVADGRSKEIGRVTDLLDKAREWMAENAGELRPDLEHELLEILNGK